MIHPSAIRTLDVIDSIVKALKTAKELVEGKLQRKERK